MTPPSAAPRVVFLNRFYWPDVAATAQMLTDLAEDLAALGWNVTVVASDTAYEGNETALPKSETRNGVRIFRTSGTKFGRHRVAGRLADYLSYMAGAFVRVMRLERHDIIVGMSDPPFIVGIALLTARIRRWRCIYWVQDLFPQIAGELGVLAPGRLAYRMADRFARWLNRSVDLVVALGPRMAEHMVAAGGRPERVAFVHNWADARTIQPVPECSNPFVKEHGLEGKFVVLYSGNAGRPHRFEGVLEAARLMRDEPEIVFLFIGGGKRTPEIQRYVAEHELRNVRFLGYLPRSELTYSLSAASVSLVTEDPAIAGLLVPSKTYGILASGRPIIFLGSASSDVAEIVRETRSGFVLAFDDGPGLRDHLQKLRGDPALMRELGNNARRAAVSTYDRTVATARWGAEVSERMSQASHGA